MNKMKKAITVFIVLIFMVSCSKNRAEKNQLEENSKDEIILCDSIYKDKKYQIMLKRFSGEKGFSKGINTVFVFGKKENGQFKELMKDSIQSDFGSFEFEDFNGDGIKDVLIENISDVRSNLTYYLYLVDLENDKLTKVKNFNEIKNPHYLPEYNLIDNEVMSGRNWTSFYQIQNDTVFDFGYVIYQGIDEDGNTIDFEKEYQETLSKVLKNKK